MLAEKLVISQLTDRQKKPNEKEDKKGQAFDHYLWLALFQTNRLFPM
jgi:hypothetical protein